MDNSLTADERIDRMADPALSADDIIDRLIFALKRKADAEADIQNCKEVLTLMRAEHLIGDTLETEELKITWTTRSSWVYSSAIKQAQDMEKAEGIATKKTSESWTVRQNTPKF